MRPPPVMPACCADILLNHAWGLFNHSELTLLEESESAAVESLLENPVGAAAGLADAEPAPLQRSEYCWRRSRRWKAIWIPPLHGEFNALRGPVQQLNDGDPEEAERLAMVVLG